MKEHPATALFPLLGDAELKALCDDISKNGQQEPVVLLNGEVIDGRNRLRACRKLGLKPKTRETKGDPFELVMSLNYHRRHLRSHEKGAALQAYLKSKGGTPGKSKGGRPSKKNGKPAHGGQVSVAGIARELGVPRQTAERQIKAAETYASLPKTIQKKVDSGECPIELAPKVTAAVERKMIKATKATKAEIQRIEDEVNELQRKTSAATKWLQSVESGCRFHEEFLLSHPWDSAERQIIDRVCKRMSQFARKVGKKR